MISILAILAIVLGIVAHVANSINKSRVEHNATVERNRDKLDLFPLKMSNGKGKLLIIVGLLVFILGAINPIGRNSYGYRQVVEDPTTGNTWVQFNQGWYYKGFFSKAYQYPNVLTVMFTDEAMTEEITSLDSSFLIRFNDATRADAQATVRWRLPNDELSMLEIHKEYHSATKLATTTLTKYTRECLRYSAQLMESETHYSGGMSKLSEDFQDQLENGQFVLEYKTEYTRDTISGETMKLTQTFIRKGEDGLPKRNHSDVQQFNITVAYASVDQVDYEPQVDEKLAEKIKASTQESISKQQLITAKQEALTEKARGERLIAKTKATEEAIKIKAVITAEKERAVAVENVIRDQAIAKSTVALRRAEAEGDKLKVAAGLTPL